MIGQINRAAEGPFCRNADKAGRRAADGFTMIEIAISLAIVAVAMVAILGILPAGLTVQRENREDTLIDLEAEYYLHLIKNSGMQFGPVNIGSHVDQVTITRTNHLTGISNQVLYNQNLTVGLGNSWQSRQVIRKLLTTPAWDLSSPDLQYIPDARFTPQNGLVIEEENVVRAVARAIGGSGAELTPANSDNAFRYEMKISIHPVLTPAIFSGYGPNNRNSYVFDDLSNTGPLGQGELLRQAALNQNLWDVELEINWPVNNFDPTSGTYVTGNNSKTYRTQVAGRLMQDQRSRNLYIFDRGSYQTQ